MGLSTNLGGTKKFGEEPQITKFGDFDADVDPALSVLKSSGLLPLPTPFVQIVDRS